VPAIAVSQLPISFGVGASLNTPAGDFADQSAAGWGAMAGVKLGIPIIGLTGIAEYLDFGSKDVDGGSRAASMWGIAAGGRFTLLPLVYGGVEIGSYSVTRSNKSGGVETEGKTTYGSYGPIVGIDVVGIDFNARYIIMDSATFTSLRATYWF
jgi:hypothetical protein